MVKKLSVGFMMVVVMVGVGYAYDSSVCGSPNDHHVMGDNVTCLGMLDESEINGDDFQKALLVDIDPHPWRILGPYPQDWPWTINEGGATGNIRFDNMRYPASMNKAPNSKISLTNAMKNTKMIPQIWAYEISQPGDDCTPDNDWHFNFPCDPNTGEPFHIVYPNVSDNYPVIVYHIDWVLSDECRQICEDDNWEFYPESPCDTCHLDPASNLGTMFRTVGETVKASDVVNVEWVEGGETVTPKYSGIEEYIYMTYNTGKNSLEQDTDWPGGADPTVFFNHFSKQAELGPQTFIVTLTNGQTIESVNNVYSNLVMPTVSTFTRGLVFDKVRRNGKIRSKKKKITVVNMKAREICAHDGSKRLLIQWAAPDGAMTLPDRARLRIYVGDGWFNSDLTGDDINSVFLWMDVPLHTSSVVVPSEYYEWIKARMTDGMLTIGGMYRQQWSSEYHNRGYFEGISFAF